MTLISEAELLQRAVLSPNSGHACTVWLTAKSTRVPQGLNLKCMQKGKHERNKEQRDSEALLQVGRERNLDFSTIHGYAQQRLSSDREPRTVVIRGNVRKLLDYPKPIRDQVILELAAILGLRSGEISSQRVGWIDWDHADIWILDSKKGMLFPEPFVESPLPEHTQELITKQKLKPTDLLIQSRKKHRKANSKSRGEGMTEHGLTQLCYRYCDLVEIPRFPLRYLRMYAAMTEVLKHGDKLDGSPLFAATLLDVMVKLRHTEPDVTNRYLQTGLDYETYKTHFVEREMLRRFGPVRCVLFEHCDLATEGCHCRMFQPQTIKETQTP